MGSAFEIFYRLQIVDTYSPELRSYNSPTDLAGSGNRSILLTMGDSFTAGNETYPNILRDKLPNYVVINSGITGTSIIEAAIVAPNRFRQFSPTVFIYQFYVGNDFFDITHPVNWATIPFVRNMYWTMSNYFRSFAFLNYRLAQYETVHRILSGQKTRPLQAADASSFSEPDIFSLEAYTQRPKINLQADPWLLEKHINVTGGREADYEIFLQKLTELTSYCMSGRCQTYILVIPHCSQINAKYLNNFKQLGARFSNEGDIQKSEYPFITILRQAVASMSDVTVLNPIDYLRRREELGEPMYFQNDDHLTPAGHHAIANFLLQEVKGLEGR